MHLKDPVIHVKSSVDYGNTNIKACNIETK